MPDQRFFTCNLCEAMCGLAFQVEGGRVVDVRADREDPFSRGHICPKGPALRETWEDPDRLRRPVMRTASGWRQVDWEQALDEAAARIRAVQERHGRDAVGVYVGNPAVHHHATLLVVQGFLRALRTRNRFDANSLDANPKLAVALAMYGDLLSLTVPDVDRTDLLVMIGANPAASNGSLMTLGDVRGRLRGIRERGGRIVLIDPRRTETAEWADEHHFIRPGADAALLAAILHVLFADGLVDRPAVSAVARGLDELGAVANRFAPERVADRVGIAADTIRGLARAIARAPRAVVYGRIGICLSEHGALASWLVEAINVVTGNFDRPGGAMFPTPAVDLASLGRRLLGTRFGRWRSRVRGLPELGGQLPAAVMAEEMEEPGQGQIRALVTIGGNPVLSGPNGARLGRALAGLQTMVSIDPWINETTRHAHVVLPPRHALEQGRYDIAFHALAVRNGAKWSEPVLPPDPDGRSDWEILHDLGMRLGGLRLGLPALDGPLRLFWRLRGARLSPDRILDLLLRTGRYGDRFVPWSNGLSLKALRRRPHGVDLGPLEPARAEKVRTEDGRLDLAPRMLVDDVARLDAWLARSPEPLVLIGRRHLRSNNSWMHNCPSLTKGPDRGALFVHPDDARRLGLEDGGQALVSSRTGQVTARVKISDTVMPGVVSLPHGFGHQACGETLRVASTLSTPSINDLTDDALVDPISGVAALNAVPVRLEPAP